jgi:molybdenum cofactor cytidylyltransferase
MNLRATPDTSRPQIGAVLLAAGSASRMGHRPKCLLELDGETLIRRQIRGLLGAGVGELVVVLGHHAERIAPLLQGVELTVVHHPDPDAGQGSSLHLGLQALRGEADAVIVALADQPLITGQDIRDLLEAHRQRPPGSQVTRPWVHGQPGNPVVFSRRAREQVLASDGQPGGKQWLAAHLELLHRWVSHNTHYRCDVDSPEDIERLAEQTGHRLRWPADLRP